METNKNTTPKIGKKNEQPYEKHDIKYVWNVFTTFLVNTLSIRGTADIEGTIEGIKKDIVFRGHTAWILIFSIFIASIGLNVNSTPVIIGAMLISPLMGPILGIGLSVGTNDWDTLTRSLKNFAIAIIISLVTSSLYFLITPLTEIQSELLARTKPTFLDVLIAIFGGFAGIVAGSQREKTNVIPGVAIATALMPPLCTAGFGIATMNMKFFLGAFYLFFLNSVFITISTFIVVKYLHFPIRNYVNPTRAKHFKRYMIIFVILVILPSAKIFSDVIKESRFNISANNFIRDNLNFEGSEILNPTKKFNDTLSVIDVYVIGREIDDITIKNLNAKLENYGLIKKGSFFKTGTLHVTERTVLRVHQAKDNTEAIVQSKIDFARNNISEDVRKGLIEDLFKKNELIISEKNKIIDSLNVQITNTKSEYDISFQQLSKELKAKYTKIEKFAYSKAIETVFDDTKDTIPTFMIQWKNKTSSSQKRREKKEIETWFKARFNFDTLRVVTF